MSIEAMKLALEAIEDLRGYRPDIDSAIETLRTALSQQPTTQCKSVQKRLAAQQPATATQAEVTLLTNMLESAQKEAQRLQKEVDRLQYQAELTDSMIREAFLANGFTIKDGHSDLKPYVYAAARAILALRPQASTDGRGTDAQILKEREIARHAIDGAIAAGYAGATHPGADHWLAAAHNAGMRIAELERAMTPVPCNTFLVRDVAELLGCSVPDVCTAFVQLGRGNRSTNMAITPDEALSVASHLALRPERVPMTEEQIRSLCKQGWVFETVKQWVRIIEAHHGITAQAKKEAP